MCAIIAPRHGYSEAKDSVSSYLFKIKVLVSDRGVSRSDANKLSLTRKYVIRAQVLAPR